MRSLSRSRTVTALGLTIALPVALRDSVPAVGLNHLTLVPDSATYEAIAASPFLRDTFALVDRSRGAGPDSGRIVLLGRSTFIEFRRPGMGGGTDGGIASRLALGTDQRGALQMIAKRLTSEVGPLQLDSVLRRRDSADVPWFYQLAASNAFMDSTLAVRVVEYHPQFLQRWYEAPPATAKSVARTDVLAVLAAAAGPSRRYPFVDVVAIKIAASSESAAHLLAHCRGVGWRVQAASTGTACVGPGVRLFVVPSHGAERGIVAFTMRFTATSKMRPLGTRTLGHSRLRLTRSGFATWEFRSD